MRASELASELLRLWGPIQVWTEEGNSTMRTRYKLPEELGGGEYWGQPMDVGSERIELQINDTHIIVPRSLLIRVKPPRPKYGDTVKARSGTGRYLGADTVLLVSPMDNSLYLDDVDTYGEPTYGIPVPTDDALYGATAVMTSSRIEWKKTPITHTKKAPQ